MDRVEVKSIKYYFKKYGERVAKGDRIDSVKSDLANEFKQEILDQIRFKTGFDDLNGIPNTGKNNELVVNIVENARKKWMSIIAKFDMYRETHGMLSLNDISFDGEDETDHDGDIND